VQLRDRMARAWEAVHMNSATPLFVVSPRPRWVIPELDARGEIDAHAAMCLQHTIQGAPTSGAGAIIVDLRDLTSIDAAALKLFVRAQADCRARGTDLGLLISGHERHDAIANAFGSAGLADQLQFTCEPLAPALAPAPALPRAPRLRRVRTVAMRIEDLRAALDHLSPNRCRRSRIP
jgi:anti-anti-sigma factor